MRFDMRKILQRLSLNHGLAILSGVHDKMITQSKIQYRSRNYHYGEDDKSIIIDGFYSIDGGHFSFEIKSDKYARIAEIALQDLEDKNHSHV